MEKNLVIPAAAAAAGMTRLAFFDDFDSEDTIDWSAEGKPGFKWYCDRPYRWNVDKPLTHDDMYIKDSYLHFEPNFCTSSIGMPTYSKKGDTGTLFHQGYFEARLRFKVTDVTPKLPGYDANVSTSELRNGWPAFWMMSVDDVMGRQWEQNGELDIFEAFLRDDRDGNSGVIYTGCMHSSHFVDEVSLTNGKRPLRQSASNMVNGTGYNDQFDFISQGWHTYAALWEDNHVAWFFDGKEMHSCRFGEDIIPEYYYRDDPTPLPRGESEQRIRRKNVWKGAHSVMNSARMVMFLGAHKTWPMDVDWVRVWQK